MAFKRYLVDKWSAGLADSEKEGPIGSFADGSRSLDIYSEPTTVGVLPKTTKISSTVVDGLIKWFSKAADGKIYAYDENGAIYENDSGTITKLRTVSNSSGNGLAYYEEDDYIYYSLDKVIGRYGPLSNSPSFDDDFLSDGTYDQDDASTAFNDSSGSTYTLTTGINEGATHLQTFTPTKDPIKALEVNINTVGTGDWTLTVHDEFNTSVAALTISNGSLSTGDQKFTFSSVWRPLLGRIYHFHLTSTVADGIVVSGTSSDLEDCDFHTYFQILIENSNFHPIIDFFETIVFGNEDYLGLWDGYTYPIESNAIRLPRGYKCRSLAKVGEYVVAGCWRDSSITDNESGLLVFWDGVSTDFNYSIEIPEGPVHAMAANQNRLFFIAGAQASLLVEADGVQKIHTFPKITNQTYVEVAPGAMSNWQTQIVFGAAYNTDSTAIEHGVYTFGHKSKNYEEALNYGYPISTGTRTGTGVKIGAVLGQGDTLHVSWKDGSSYGWDTVGSSSAPYSTALWKDRIMDDGTPYKQKLAKTLVAYHTPLQSGESVTLGYAIDRADSPTEGDANSTSNSTQTILPINTRFREIQDQASFGASSSAPKIIGLVLEYDDLEEEDRVSNA